MECLGECGREARNRGLCHACYQSARRAVLSGKITWKKMEENIPPLAMPPESPRGDSAIMRKIKECNKPRIPNQVDNVTDDLLNVDTANKAIDDYRSGNANTIGELITVPAKRTRKSPRVSVEELNEYAKKLREAKDGDLVKVPDGISTEDMNISIFPLDCSVVEEKPLTEPNVEASIENSIQPGRAPWEK